MSLPIGQIVGQRLNRQATIFYGFFPFIYIDSGHPLEGR